MKNFFDTNRELFEINNNISESNFRNNQPVNTIHLFLWLIIILMLSYVVIEYITNRGTSIGPTVTDSR